ESVVEPHSPNRHHMRTPVICVKSRMNRGQPECPATVHPSGNPSPRKQSLAVLSPDNAVAWSNWTIRHRLRLRSRRLPLLSTLRHNPTALRPSPARTPTHAGSLQP